MAYNLTRRGADVCKHRMMESPVSLLSKHDLISNKRAVGRPQDLLDLAKLEVWE
jgi:hypothetical protein